MQKLEARLVMLGNYNFLDTLSPPVKQEDVIRDVNGMLKAAFFDDNGILVRPCPGKDLSGVEVMVAEVYARVHGDELYQKLLKAYRADNQPYIADVATSVFSSIRRVRNPGCLVHGVRITQGMTPEEYVDLGMKILKEGIRPSVIDPDRPSETDIHNFADENIRPVFFVADADRTHGLLYFSAKPGGYAVFDPDNEDERLVYTPHYRARLELVLKSRAHLEQRIQEGKTNIEAIPLWTSARTQAFRDEVQRLLSESGIAFYEV